MLKYSIIGKSLPWEDEFSVDCYNDRSDILEVRSEYLGEKLQ